MLQTVPVGGFSAIAQFSLGYDISLVELLVQQMQAYPEAGVPAFELLFNRVGSTKIRQQRGMHIERPLEGAINKHFIDQIWPAGDQQKVDSVLFDQVGAIRLLAISDR